MDPIDYDVSFTNPFNLGDVCELRDSFNKLVVMSDCAPCGAYDCPVLVRVFHGLRVGQTMRVRGSDLCGPVARFTNQGTIAWLAEDDE